MTKAHRDTLLQLAQENGIEASMEPNYISKYHSGKPTDGVVVCNKAEIEKLTELFKAAAAKGQRFRFSWDNLGRGFVMF
jgi:hypothetical protein